MIRRQADQQAAVAIEHDALAGFDGADLPLRLQPHGSLVGKVKAQRQ